MFLQRQPPEVFYKKAAFKNFAIFTWKHLCWGPFLTKLHTWRPATLSKADSNTGVFRWILRNFWNTYFEENLRRSFLENILFGNFKFKSFICNFNINNSLPIVSCIFFVEELYVSIDIWIKRFKKEKYQSSTR